MADLFDDSIGPSMVIRLQWREEIKNGVLLV
jgi:hypothetical protein